MSLALANELAADLSDLDLARHYEFVVRALAARHMHETVPPPPRRDQDELEQRRTWPSPDTLPAPPKGDDGG